MLQPPSQDVLRLQKRVSPRNPAGPFADLTWSQQRAAEQWLFKFCAKWGNDLPNWRRGILIGVARRLAKNPPAVGWGLSMLRVRSGHGLARKCRREGIPNPGTAALLRWHDRRRSV